MSYTFQYAEVLELKKACAEHFPDHVHFHDGCGGQYFSLDEENDALCGVHFCPDGAPELEPLPRRVVETPLLQEAEEQLNEYFAGVRREFDLPLAAKGTPFQQAVWAQLRKIPYGEVRTYGQLAAALGKPKASRAVGSACHRNPLCIVVPCHRVIGADGSLTGYAEGLEIKEYLLELERF